MEKLFGIDISHWQGDMSIEQARNERGVRFAIIKAAGADDGKYKDSKFENYYAQCKAIGLPVGAYYYGNAKSVAEAEQEADHFLSVIAGKQFEYPIYYDVEGKIGYSYQSLLIEKLLNAGFKNFILATSLAKQYEEYSKCLEGYYEENGIDIKATEEPQQIIRQKVKTIGIAGTIPRIGTTTTSLQLVKYIESRGYNAAYVEINTLKYIEQCEKLYADVKRDNNKSYLKYNGIRMYVSSNMGEVMSDDYNYIICDYGAVVDPSFNKVSFLEKDLNIFVAGTKANEIECVQPLLQSPIYREAKYIFNFTPENDKEDIKDMMMDKKDDTYFNVLVADPFDYIHNPEYERLLPLGEAKENNTEKKKLGFLARLRK